MYNNLIETYEVLKIDYSVEENCIKFPYNTFSKRYTICDVSRKN